MSAISEAVLDDEKLGAAAQEAEGWRMDRQGRAYTPRKRTSGIVYRKGNETIEEALARDDKGPRDSKPKGAGKPKTPKAPAPTQVTLKELEFALVEALSAPSMLAAMQGDMWAADHFTKEAPTLARNLTAAAEHNPWLRAKLEAFMSGDAFLMRIMTLFPVGAALISYALPPIIYYFDPGFIPAAAREMFRVPDRDELRHTDDQEPEDAAQAAPSATANGAAPAVTAEA